MWRKSFSTVKPLEAEKVVGGRYILRRNIVKSTQTDQDGNPQDTYNYEERIVTEEEYGLIDTINSLIIRREAEIVDEYTMKLIEEGVL